MIKAKCIKELPIFNIQLNDIIDIVPYTEPYSHEQIDVVIFNEVCYTQVGSGYFDEYFEIVEEVNDD